MRDTILVDRVDGAPGFHAIEFRVDSPYLFYQPVNDRARGEGPRSKNVGGMAALSSLIPRWRSPDLRRDIRPCKHEQENHNQIDCDRQHLTSLREPGSLSDRGTEQPKNGGSWALWPSGVSPVILACALGVGLVPSTGSGATWFLCKKASLIQRLVRTYL